MAKYGVSISRTYCCGVLEVGSFQKNVVHYPVLADTFPQLLDKIKEHNATQGRMIHIHFKRIGKRNWQWGPLRTLVKRMPNVVHMGLFRNSNSGNVVDSYCWINNPLPIDE
jgi:hypothetical protein